jgi:hypothetical protein
LSTLEPTERMCYGCRGSPGIPYGEDDPHIAEGDAPE